MAPGRENPGGRGTLLNVLLVGAAAAAVLAVFVLAPTERTMGDAQRVLYAHVSVAWFGLASFVVMAATGLMYLIRRDLAWDHWSHAAAELGWLCCGLTLVTGSLWAHAAWGTWWTWDPRLTSCLVLWAIYSGYLILRTSLEDPHRRARIAAVVAVVGMLDLPLVVMATRWFRGMHPVSPEMDPAMRLVLLVSVVSFSIVFGILLVRRRAQIRLEGLLINLQQDVDSQPFNLRG